MLLGISSSWPPLWCKPLKLKSNLDQFYHFFHWICTCLCKMYIVTFYLLQYTSYPSGPTIEVDLYCIHVYWMELRNSNIIIFSERWVRLNKISRVFFSTWTIKGVGLPLISLFYFHFCPILLLTWHFRYFVFDTCFMRKYLDIWQWKRWQYIV